jgi:hypothetical protein
MYSSRWLGVSGSGRISSTEFGHARNIGTCESNVLRSDGLISRVFLHSEHVHRQDRVRFFQGFPAGQTANNSSFIWMDATPPSLDAMKGAPLKDNPLVQEVFSEHYWPRIAF